MCSVPALGTITTISRHSRHIAIHAPGLSVERDVPTDSLSSQHLLEFCQRLDEMPSVAEPTVQPAPLDDSPKKHLYHGSTQYRNWRFSLQQLRDTRQSMSQASVAAIKNILEGDEVWIFTAVSEEHQVS